MILVLPVALLAVGVTLLGMSAPSAEWNARLAETGPVYVHRLFSSSPSVDSVLPEARADIAAGRLPVITIKPGTWSSVAKGSVDATMRSNYTKLAALGGPVVIGAHHEPVGDTGLPADWARMQVRILPILEGTATDRVASTVIFNGHPFRTNGYTDAQIGAYLTPGVLAVTDYVAGDFYHAGTITAPGEGPAVRLTRFADWAKRQGIPASRLGVGEMGAHSATALPRRAAGALWTRVRVRFVLQQHGCRGQDADPGATGGVPRVPGGDDATARGQLDRPEPSSRHDG